MELKGFVTPRYLDRDWYQNFTVTANRNKDTDIPIKVVVEYDAFKSSKVSNDMPTYQDLKSENYNLRCRIKCLNVAIKNLEKTIKG